MKRVATLFVTLVVAHTALANNGPWEITEPVEIDDHVSASFNFDRRQEASDYLYCHDFNLDVPLNADIQEVYIAFYRGADPGGEILTQGVNCAGCIAGSEGPVPEYWDGLYTIEESWTPGSCFPEWYDTEFNSEDWWVWITADKCARNNNSYIGTVGWVFVRVTYELNGLPGFSEGYADKAFSSYRD